MKHLLISVMLLSLTGCGSLLGAGLKAVTGGGPSVSAESQIGQENRKQGIVGQESNIDAGGDVDSSSSKVKSESVGQVTIHETSFGLTTFFVSLITVLAIVAGVFLALPTPNFMKKTKDK